MRTWPDILPVPSQTAFQRDPMPQSMVTDMESGEQRARRFTFAKRDDVSLSWRMKDAEYGLFVPWYYDDPWSLSGDSESLAAFTQNNLTSITYPSVGPDGQAAARLTENTLLGVHAARLNLSAVPQSAGVAARATIKAGTRGFARIVFNNWANVFCNVLVDLSTGAFTGGTNYLTRVVKDRGTGWWRIEMTASAGTGAATPYFRIDMGSAATTFNYTGDGISYMDVCEQQCRVITGGLDGHLRADASGNVLGAGAGSAWFTMPVPFGGGMTTKGMRMPSMTPKAFGGGANWEIAAKLRVR